MKWGADSQGQMEVARGAGQHRHVESTSVDGDTVPGADADVDVIIEQKSAVCSVCIAYMLLLGVWSVINSVIDVP